jgi:hypothetical protein
MPAARSLAMPFTVGAGPRAVKRDAKKWLLNVTKRIQVRVVKPQVALEDALVHMPCADRKGHAMTIDAKPVEVIATPALTDDEWSILVAVVGLVAAIGKASN